MKISDSETFASNFFATWSFEENIFKIPFEINLKLNIYFLEPPPNARTCHEASDCHQNAHCVSSDNSVNYFCECLPGFKGDGVTQCIVAGKFIKISKESHCIKLSHFRYYIA